MDYFLVGMNHHTAPIHIRERVSLDIAAQKKVLAFLKTQADIAESFVISTCNRTEIYAVSSSVSAAQNILYNTLSAKLDESTKAKQYFYFKQGRSAVQHLFNVGCGLDSQVIGETQISGQMRSAYKQTQQQQTIAYYLHKLIDRTFFVSKRVRHETEIGKGNVSIGSVAVALAKKVLGTLDQKVVLLLGAGEVGELVIKHLNTESVQETYIVNRTFEKAKNLENKGFGRAYPIDKLNHLLQKVDVLITSVSGDFPVLSAKGLRQLMKQRYQKNLLIIDLSVPRCAVLPSGGLPHLHLYNVDDLRDVSEEQRQQRMSAVERAQNIIDQEIKLFYEDVFGCAALPTITKLGKKLERIRQTEVQKTLTKMGHLSAKDTQKVEKLTRVIVSRILQEPVLSLKSKSDISKPAALAVLGKLFGLEE